MALIPENTEIEKYQIADNAFSLGKIVNADSRIFMLLEKLNDTTYKRVIKADIKDELNVVIGDDKQADFKPQIKIERWGNLDGTNEANVSIRLKESENELKETATITEEDGKIKYIKSKRECHFYDIQNEEHPEGASEFEIIENEPSGLDYVDFTINCKDAEFFKQPELTQEEKDQGASRPDNVVNSLAIYAKAPKTNWTGGKEYKCGKIGHIFRDKVIDSVGNWAWTDPEFIPNEDGETGILRVHRPTEFLAKAVYPIRHAAGLTFGYETIGTTGIYNAGNYQACGSLFTIGVGAGTANSITVYHQLFTYQAGDEFKTAIYLHSNLSLVGSSAATDLVTGTAAWKTATMSSESLSASTDYVLMAMSDILPIRSWNMVYDTGSTDQGHQQNIGSFTFPNPLVPTHYNYRFSIYATYTAGGENPTAPLPLFLP